MIKSLFTIILFFFINSGAICSDINHLFNEANDLFLKKIMRVQLSSTSQ